jgi:AcrR family transcriptional regulator
VGGSAARVSRAAPRRVRARRGEGEKLKEQILEAAERLLVVTEDEEAVSIRAVAEAVGVTPPSIYLHFEDKDDLLVAVCERRFAQLDRALEEAGADALDPVGALIERGRAYVRFGLEYPELYRILFLRRVGPRPIRADRTRDVAAFDHHLAAVSAAVESGAMKGDPLLVAVGLWAAVHGITSLLITKPHFEWPELDPLIDHVLHTQIRGLSTPDTEGGTT